MKKRWGGLDRCWGPGGSVGFELAAGRHVAKPESDLDIVIYAEERITRDMAKSLDVQTLNVAAAVDVRVETPLCGFSLKEYAWRSQGGILLRTPSGITLGTDPWSDEIPITRTDQVTERG